MVCRSILLVFVSFSLLPSLAASQLSGVPAQTTQTLDETKLTVLTGNTHPLARFEFDRGAAPLDLPLNRMLLVLQRSRKEQAGLQLLLDQLQNKSSSNYHAWLTPQQFGHKFGPTDQDIQTITSWLASHGFQVEGVAKGRGIIEFSGTAGQLKEAFHTEVHRYEVNGKVHWANSTDPKIPAALTRAVAGIASLHDFPRKPLHQLLGVISHTKDTGRYQLLPSLSAQRPLFTTGGGNCGLAGGSCYAVAPYDLATIYNVLPLWNANPSIDGTGQTIAIVGHSDIYPQDFSFFRSNFGLPPATLNIIYNGSPPGKLASQGDELESDLDVEWSGAVASKATIDLVASKSTNSTSGVDLSALYIVDNNLAPIMSESYGACELDLGTAGNQFYSQFWQQAAAEGITVFVATGDSGSAVCGRNSSIASQELSVNGISSTPYNIAVGGTDFDDLQNQATYWNSTNDPATKASAKSYIPETSWNDTCTNSEFFIFTGDTTTESQCNDNASGFWPDFPVPGGGSGGASNCTTSTNQSPSSCAGGYAKPLWEAGAGVPNDGKRDVPDVSLYAGDGLNSSFYVVCETDIYGGCEIALGGTSASAPAFAGIMAMVNQKTQSRQGNANYVFYPLAAQPGASCDSTGTIGSSCIFYDVTAGTIAMPCVNGSPNCVTNTASDLNGVLPGYATTAGYDLATGLGSVNVANLVNSWDTVSFQPTIASLSISPTTNLTHGSPVNMSITVTPASGTGTPSGMASLLTSKGQPAGNFTVTNGAVSGTTDVLPGGSYTVTAHYAGDGTYAASDSSPGIAVTVAPEPSTTTVEAFSLDQNGNRTPFTGGPYGGTVVYLSASVARQSGQGRPTGTVDLTQTLNGTTTEFPGAPYTLNIQGLAMVPFPGYNYWAYTPGTYTMAAAYSGDESFQKSTASSASFTITRAQTNTTATIVGCTPVNGVCVVCPGVMVTIFASLSYRGGAFDTGGVFIDPPTGTMTFYSHGTALGPAVPVDSNIIPPFASTSATLPGPGTITAQYSGDSNFTGSVSPAILLGGSATFAITASPTAINIASPGQSGSTTLTFAAQNGLTGTAALSPSMCSNPPPKSTCSFSPANVTLTSSTPTGSVILTITTMAASPAVASAKRSALRRWPGSGGIAAVFAVGICVLGIGTRRRYSSAIVAWVTLAVIIWVVGCGGSGGTGGGGGGGGSLGTPPGNYMNVTVTVAMNDINQSINNLNARLFT